MKTYEDLTGATGRHIFYRAERFDVRDLFTRMAPKVLIEGAPYSLVNLSMSGLAASAARSNRAQFGLSNRAQFKVGTEVEVVLEGDTGSLYFLPPAICVGLRIGRSIHCSESALRERHWMSRPLSTATIRH